VHTWARLKSFAVGRYSEKCSGTFDLQAPRRYLRYHTNKDAAITSIADGLATLATTCRLFV